MPVTVKLRRLGIAPRKVRLVADLVRGKSVEEAQTILNFTVKKAAHPLLKLLKSAIASARHDFKGLDESNLRIVKITVDQGPKYKRWRPRARGVAYEIQKKTSHITLVLDEIAKKTKKKVSEQKEIGEAELGEKEIREEQIKAERPKFKAESGIKRPKIEKGIKRIFRRKAF